MVLPLKFRVIVVISAIFILFSIYLINRDSKPKSEYGMICGSINYVDNKYNDLPNRNFGKYRYIKIDQYPYVFELFIGKDASDFKPRYENIDKLKIGDTIKIYGYETSVVVKEGINRNVQFIEKNNVVFFERGDSSKIIGYTIIILSLLLMILGFIIWKKGKIGY